MIGGMCQRISTVLTDHSFAVKRHLFSVLCVLALLLLLMKPGSASDRIIERNHYLASNFRVLAYNIYMRPAGVFADDQADRGAALPSKLRGFDVIVFSEAF